MPGCLAKIAGMASSSKRRRASSSKQSSAGKARVISAKRTDALPRKGNVATGRRKPVVQPPIEAPLEPLATAVAGSNKKAHGLQETETSASRTKTTRAAGRASGKLKRPAAMKPEVGALALIETEVEVEASAIVEEITIVEAPFALPIEAVTFPGNEIGRLPACEETRWPPLVHTAVASPAPAAPAPHHGMRALVTVVSQLLSTLRRWTGVR